MSGYAFIVMVGEVKVNLYSNAFTSESPVFIGILNERWRLKAKPQIGLEKMEIGASLCKIQ